MSWRWVKRVVLELQLQLFGHWNSALWTYNSWFRGFDQWGPTQLPTSQRRTHPRIERVSWPQGWSPLENSTLWSRVLAQWERKMESSACKQRPEQPPPKAKVPMYIRIVHILMTSQSTQSLKKTFPKVYITNWTLNKCTKLNYFSFQILLRYLNYIMKNV